MVPAHMSVLLNTGRGIDAEICGMNSVFPPDDPGSVWSQPQDFPHDSWLTHFSVLELWSGSIIAKGNTTPAIVPLFLENEITHVVEYFDRIAVTSHDHHGCFLTL